MKPVFAVAALHRLKEISQLEGPGRIQTPSLGHATRRDIPEKFEQAVREALVELRQALASIEQERDGVVRHLSYRALSHEVRTSGLDGRALSEGDERTYARQLVQQVHQHVAHSFQQLDFNAQRDVELLLHLEERMGQRAERRQAATDAAQQLDDSRGQLQQMEREVARLSKALQNVSARQPRPMWLRAVGVILSLAGVTAGTVTFSQRNTVELPWVWMSVGVIVGAAGLWLSVDSTQRRAWMRSALEKMVERRKGVVQRAAEAQAALERAKVLFEQIDAECRRDEEALKAVMERRPGALRFLGAQTALILTGKRP